jgi:hypothetical protein
MSCHLYYILVIAILLFVSGPICILNATTFSASQSNWLHHHFARTVTCRRVWYIDLCFGVQTARLAHNSAWHHYASNYTASKMWFTTKLFSLSYMQCSLPAPDPQTKTSRWYRHFYGCEVEPFWRSTSQIESNRCNCLCSGLLWIIHFVRQFLLFLYWNVELGVRNFFCSDSEWSFLCIVRT